MAGFNNQAATPWSIFNDKQMKKYAEPWDKESPRECPAFTYKVVNNKPRFQVYLNKPGAFEKPIQFVLTASDMNVWLNSIIEMADNGGKEDRISTALMSMYPHNGPKTERSEVISQMMVGRGADGIIYIAFAAKEEPVAKLTFRNSYIAQMRDAAGEPLDPIRASELEAKGWAKMLIQLTNNYLIANPVVPEGTQQPKRSSSSGGKGSWDSSDVPF